jgi:LPXTG-site transpeptidase (sortase) family protein
MNPDDPFSHHDPGATFPLPNQPYQQQDNTNNNPAADLVRQKVHSAYSQEPDAATEALDTAEQGSDASRSTHQQFIIDLTNSGKSLAEIQQAWHEYYAGLPDDQKHMVWQEFYSTHAQASQYSAAQQSMSPATHIAQHIAEPQLEYEEIPLTTPNFNDHKNKPLQNASRTVADLRDYAMGNVSSRKKLSPMQHMQSILFGLGVGSVVVLIFLFSFFNERFIAPFIQPSRNISNTEIISGNVATSNTPEVIIPKINVEIPVVYDLNTINENEIDKALERGVVHYATTADPGQNGNVVVVGHSSNNIFNPGKYKFAFVLLSRMEKGDTFYLQKDGKRYTYQVFEKKIVKPSEVSVLQANEKQATATLITCDPPGTSTNRLVVVGQQISPDVSSNLAEGAPTTASANTAVLPGSSPSLWSRFWHWFSS